MSFRSRRSVSIRTLVAIAGCACTMTGTLAQDSVSSTTGVGGDAIGA